ncbi:hypothetical protein FH603_1859 [Spirosoma sp. LMG 31447]|uniref:Uncharacterized protein n=1 Tax=Spirosoma utsteinense TaxID=2585773 RepID=A0ABR6W491_9BACT|nr:hypothetical protein [Spirosoma utsteinense]
MDYLSIADIHTPVLNLNPIYPYESVSVSVHRHIP